MAWDYSQKRRIDRNWRLPFWFFCVWKCLSTHTRYHWMQAINTLYYLPGKRQQKKVTKWSKEACRNFFVLNNTYLFHLRLFYQSFQALLVWTTNDSSLPSTPVSVLQLSLHLSRLCSLSFLSFQRNRDNGRGRKPNYGTILQKLKEKFSHIYSAKATQAILTLKTNNHHH